MGGTDEIVFLAQVALLLLVGRGLGEFVERWGQPAVVGQLMAGLLLGPSLFGWVWPQAHDLIFPANGGQKSPLASLSEIGALMLLLLTGLETDLKLARQVGVHALAVAIAGLAVPFVCGFALGQFLPVSLLPNPADRLVASLFLGTALSISSVKVVATVVRDMNFTRRNLGQIIVASAIVEDSIGWVVVSVVLGLAGSARVDPASLATTIVGAVLFLILSYAVGRRLVFWLMRWVNDTFTSDYAVVTAILIVMCAMALMTQAIGVNAVLGAFVAGVLVGESPILSRHIDDQLRGLITAFMMPIFFGASGLSADLTILKDPGLALLTVGFIAIASFGKFAGAFVGGVLSGLSRQEALALGCGMNARGSTEVIIASVGLTMGALTQNLYTMIVTMAIATTMAMPPMLRWALRQVPLRPEEQERLAKEELDARGFVSQLERFLIVADDSANGKFASHIAGFIAGQRGKPVTVLHQSGRAKARRGKEPEPNLKAVATRGASKGQRAAKEGMSEVPPNEVEISERVGARGSPSAVTEEAEKGYDLLFIGIENMRNADGALLPSVDRLAAAFKGPVVLALADRDAKPRESWKRILVPINGTEASRRGAEIAFALSSAKASSMRIVHVRRRTETSDPSPPDAPMRRKAEQAVLDDVIALARRYGFPKIDTASKVSQLPADAILKEARRCHADLIVTGATRRTGSSMYLGPTVDGVLRHWRRATVLVVT